MRIIHVITRLIVGGAQENTIATVLGLKAKPEVDVYLVSGPTSGPEGSLEDRLSADLLIKSPHLVRSVSPLQDLRALIELTKIYKNKKPHIVHTHSGKAGFLGRLAAKIVNIPIIIHTIHGPSFGRFQSSVANLIFKSAERIAGSFTTHFISVADAMTELYLGAGIGRREMYSTIYSGFNLQPFLTARNDLQLRSQYGILPEDIVIGKIARLTKLKGHDDLFKIAPELLREHPNVKIMLVGDGLWHQRFKRLTEDLGLINRIIFTGLVSPEQIPGLIGLMDIVVHLSYREGIARSLPQAMAAGKPVVAYDCDGAKEVCIPGKTGFLIAAGDVRSVHHALKALIENCNMRQTLGMNGQRLVQSKFAVESMVESIYVLYVKLYKKYCQK